MGNGMMTQQERDYFEALARDRAESARVLEKPSLEKVQDRVKSAIENMTGLEVDMVNIRIVNVNMDAAK